MLSSNLDHYSPNKEIRATLAHDWTNTYVAVPQAMKTPTHIHIAQCLEIG